MLRDRVCAYDELDMCVMRLEHNLPAGTSNSEGAAVPELEVSLFTII